MHLKHLLGIEKLSKEELLFLLKNAQSLVEISQRELKKVPALRGKMIINLFLEPSTRTRSSFEIAAKRLSADTINVGASDSSVVKGESLFDTAKNLEAMHPDVIVLRHKESGACEFLAQHLTHCSVVNAGDGLHEHPTQALLDLLTLREHFGKSGRSLQGLKISILGDVFHSRVARSNIFAHALLGNQVTVIGPATLVPKDFENFGTNNVRVAHQLSAIEGSDVIITLRMQLERQSKHFVPSLQEYSENFCLNKKVVHSLAPHAVILHPGPVNRGVEISSDLLDSDQALVFNQVSNGVAVRMAVLLAVATSGKEKVV